MAREEYHPGDRAYILSQNKKVTVTDFAHNGTITVRDEDGEETTVRLSDLGERLYR